MKNGEFFYGSDMNATFKKQCNVPVTLTYNWQIENSSNSREIKCQKIGQTRCTGSKLYLAYPLHHVGVAMTYNVCIKHEVLLII